MSGPRILHYIETFSLLTETFLYQQVRGQREVGIDARVLTHRRVDEEQRPFPEVCVVRRPGRLSAASALARLGRLAAGRPLWNRGSRSLAAALKSEGADLLHAHYGWSGSYTLEAARRAGVPMVTSFYGRDATEGQGPEAARTLPHLFQGSARVLALSGRMADRLAGMGCPRDRIVVHHLPVDTGSLTFRPPAPPTGEERKIVTVGRLVPKKGIDVLIDAVGTLARAGRGIHLEIIGGGPEEEALRAAAARMPGRASVRFSGALPNDEVTRRLREAHVFVLASRVAPDGDAEGTPTVLLEAQALGLPVVSTLHEGIPDCLPPANHRHLAPEGDARALAAAIERLAWEPGSWDEVARAGRAWVEERFDAKRLARRAGEIYRDVLGGRGLRNQTPA